GRKAYYYVSLKYDESFIISKTNYEAVEIKVSDKNPQIACDMVNAVIGYYNKKVRKVQNEKFKEIYALYDQMYKRKYKEIDSLNSLLKGMHTTHQLIDFDKQTTEMIRGYLRTIDGASRTSINTPEVLSLKKELEASGTDFYIIDNQFRQAVEELGKIKEDADVAYKDYHRDFSFINVVTAPFPAEKSYYPVRWLITLSAMLVTLITSLIVVTLIENKNQILAAFTSLKEQ
ncbi:MAG: hypothetical protein Q8908_15210, partial [Bacteroidota bacterium]|nr:hypothetical protein [Bacteroidota bacterium]